VAVPLDPRLDDAVDGVEVAGVKGVQGVVVVVVFRARDELLERRGSSG
jgi:hypothetical protein